MNGKKKYYLNLFEEERFVTIILIKYSKKYISYIFYNTF